MAGNVIVRRSSTSHNRLNDKDFVLISNICSDTAIKYSNHDEGELQQVSVNSSNLHHSTSNNHRARQNTPSGSSSDLHNDPNATPMVYLNMNTDQPDMELDEEPELHINTMVYANGVNNSTANIETRFPKQTIRTIEVDSDYSSHEERFVIQSADGATRTVTDGARAGPRQKDTEVDVEFGCLPMEHYVDLPEVYTILFLYIGLGICFVTGMLVMVIFTQLEVVYVGATTTVLLFIIILPAVFFLMACGCNVFGLYLGRKLEKEDE